LVAFKELTFNGAMPRTGTASEQAFALVDEIRTLGALDFMRPVLNEAA
tara:strand:- start:270 stop:413 length:144 start_codon:yes stop_codon:yes gene_type:complete